MNQRPWRKIAQTMTSMAIASTLWLHPVNIFAQENNQTPVNNAAEDDSDITITATKTPRMVDFTPGEVSIISKKTLEENQVRSLQDIVRYEPGVEVLSTIRGIGEKPVIRGMSGERVLINVDGTRMTFDSGHKGQFFIDPDWLKRVEIIRGPGSALYGSNAMGGVISLQTIDPADLLEAGKTFGVKQSFGYQFGNDELSSTSSFFGSFGENNEFEYLGSFNFRDGNDNYMTGDRKDINYSEQEMLSGLGKLIWNMSEEDKLTFSYMAFNADQITPSNAASNVLSTSQVVDRVTFQQNWRLNYAHQDIDNPFWDINATVYYNKLSIEEDIVGGTQHDDIDFDTLGFELRNTSRFENDDMSLALTYGIEIYQDTQDATRDGADFYLFPAAESTNTAFYVQAEIELFDGLLTVIPGVRADWYSMESDSEDQDYDNVSPKVGALLTLDDELNLADGDYVILEGSYGESFRAPSFGELFISGAHFPGAFWIPNPDLKPETSWTAEGGVRVKFGKIKARGTYFQTKAENYIGTETNFIPPATLNFQYVNISKASIHGVELSAQWEAMDNLYLWGNYAYTEGDDDTNDTPLTSIPPQNAKFGIDYFFENLGLSVGLRSRFYDSYTRVPDPSTDAKYSGFMLFDFVSTWKPAGPSIPNWMNGLELGFALENLADKNFTWYTGSPGHGINPALTVSYTKSW